MGFQNRYAVFLRAPRINRGLVDHEVTRLEGAGDRPRCGEKRPEVGLVRRMDGSGDGDDVEVCGLQVSGIGREGDVAARKGL